MSKISKKPAYGSYPAVVVDEMLNDLATKDELTSYALKTELPTNTSDLTNDSDFVVDANYVHTDYNFTQSAVSQLLECTLFKNNYTPIIDTLVSDTDALSSSKADKEDTYTKTEVDNKLASVYTYKGTVETVADLDLITTPSVGDVYDVLATGDNYAWNGTLWDKLAGIVDLSGYALKTEIPTNTSALTNDSNFVVDANYVHTDNNFTTDEKTKLSGLNNTVVVQEIGESTTDVISQAGITGALMSKVDSVAGKTLTSNDYTNEDKSKLDLMFNYDDTEVRAEITALETTKADKATTYTKEEIDAQRSGVYRFMGSVATYAELPTTGNTNGDVYNTTDTDANFAWDGTEWDGLGSTIDLTAYALKSYVDDMKAELMALIDAKLDKDTIKVLSNTTEYETLTPQEKLETIAFIEEV